MRKIPCTIDGVEYKSLASASRNLGITYDETVRRLASFDYPDYICEQHPKKPPERAKLRRYPCMVNGAHYKSEYEAAKILGFHINGLRRRLKSSTFPDYISKHHPKEKRRVIVPCSVAGVDYKSVGSAARDLKVRYDEMKRRLASTDYPDYVCDKYPKKPTKVFKYEVRGEKYKTMREIADVEGLSRGRIQQKIKSSKYPEYRKI